MAPRKVLILWRPQSGRLEGRTTLIRAPVDFLTAQFVVPAEAGTQEQATEIPGFPLSRERRI